MEWKHTNFPVKKKVLSQSVKKVMLLGHERTYHYDDGSINIASYCQILGKIHLSDGFAVDQCIFIYIHANTQGKGMNPFVLSLQLWINNRVDSLTSVS